MDPNGDSFLDNQVNQCCCLVYIMPHAFKFYATKMDSNANFRLYLTSLSDKESTVKSDSFQVSSLDEQNCLFVPQSNLGTLYDNRYLVFRNTFRNQTLSGDERIQPEGIKVDLLQEIDGKLLATSFILFHNRSPGSVKSLIINENNLAIGEIMVRYCVIRPFKSEKYTIKDNICPDFLESLKKGIHVGHRGCGPNRRDDLPLKILENTILSFNYAAQHGADMVEFDVHLTKDNVPIIYHDFDIRANFQTRNEKDNFGQDIRVQDLTFKQIKSLKFDSTRANGAMVFNENDPSENQPFCTLEDAFKNVQPCMFNVEIKYDTNYEGYSDMNEYVDVILDTIFKYRADRKIVLSSFDPDVCAMARIKQRELPVLFLTEQKDRFSKVIHPDIHDYRMATLEMACHWAFAIGLQGVDCLVMNLMLEEQLIQYVVQKNILLYCYGGEANKTSIVDRLMELGVHGIIYDKIDLLRQHKK